MKIKATTVNPQLHWFLLVRWSRVKMSLAVRINDISWRSVIFFHIQLGNVGGNQLSLRQVGIYGNQITHAKFGQKKKHRHGHMIPNNVSCNIRDLFGFLNCGIVSCSSFGLVTDRELIHYNKIQTTLPGYYCQT